MCQHMGCVRMARRYPSVSQSECEKSKYWYGVLLSLNGNYSVLYYTIDEYSSSHGFVLVRPGTNVRSTCTEYNLCTNQLVLGVLYCFVPDEVE